MCQVTNDNFETLYPEICSHIDNCSFLAFDCEFTALRADSSQRNSLFDDLQTRFTKLSQAPVPSIISQFGLAIFQQNIQAFTIQQLLHLTKSFCSVAILFVYHQVWKFTREEKKIRKIIPELEHLSAS